MPNIEMYSRDAKHVSQVSGREIIFVTEDEFNSTVGRQWMPKPQSHWCIMTFNMRDKALRNALNHGGSLLCMNYETSFTDNDLKCFYKDLFSRTDNMMLGKMTVVPLIFKLDEMHMTLESIGIGFDVSCKRNLNEIIRAIGIDKKWLGYIYNKDNDSKCVKWNQWLNGTNP